MAVVHYRVYGRNANCAPFLYGTYTVRAAAEIAALEIVKESFLSLPQAWIEEVTFEDKPLLKDILFEWWGSLDQCQSSHVILGSLLEQVGFWLNEQDLDPLTLETLLKRLK